MNKVKHIFAFIILLNLFSCTTPLILNYGIKNLEEIQNNINIGKSNINDVRKLLGEAIIKEYPDEKNWIYIEVVKQKNFFGGVNNIKNNMLILSFDDKGILKDKNLLTLKDIKNLKFDTTETKTLAIDNQITKKFFASIRKRIQNTSNTQASK